MSPRASCYPGWVVPDRLRPRSVPPAKPAAGRARPRVALLASSLADEYYAGIIHGARDAALARGMTFYCFVGARLAATIAEERRRAHIFEFVDRSNIDAVALGPLGGVGELADVMKGFGDMAKCTIALPVDGVSCVKVDNRAGVREAIAHLVRVHQRRKIAFVTGIAGASDGEERYLAYLEALKEQNLPVDHKLITEGYFSFESGVRAVKALFRRDLSPRDVDAIVCGDDATALGVMHALAQRDIEVPRQISVVGF